jgi:hypothetical protein
MMEGRTPSSRSATARHSGVFCFHLPRRPPEAQAAEAQAPLAEE